MAARAAARQPIDDSKPLWRYLAAFLIPLMLSNILQAASGTLNSIFLGRLIGVHALAAVSSFFPILFFLISFLIGLSSGSSVLIGQAFGARDNAMVKKIAGTTLTLGVLLGALVAIVGAFGAHQILLLLGTPVDILPQAEQYSKIVFFSLPVFFMYLVYTTFLRGTGDTLTPFVSLIAATLLSALATPALILGWLGLPKLDINSAAVASIFANLTTLLGLIVYLNIRKHPLAFDAEMLRNLRLRRDIVTKVVKIGIPTGLQLVMVSLSEIAVLAFVNRFGSTATAAYGAVNQVVSYVQFPAISIGIAASIFGAQSIGAGRLDRIPKVVRSGVVLNYVIGGTLIGLAYLLTTPLLSLFLTDAHTLDIARSLLHITLWGYLLFGNSAVLNGVMRSSGTVLWPTLLAVASIWGIEVPVAWWLSQTSLGLTGVWIAYPAAFVVNLCLQSGYYFLFWRKKKIERLV